MTEQIKIEAKAHFPFSPLVLEVKVPNDYIEKLNMYMDMALGDKELLKKLDHSHDLAGNLNTEIKITNQFLEETRNEWGVSLLQFFSNIGSAYCQNMINKTNITKFIITGAWMNNQVAGDFNPIHKHDGLLSSVLFTKVPISISNNEEKDYAGYLEFIDGRDAGITPTHMRIKPVVGRMYMFPSWLLHQVYPFRGNGHRRSVSFNSYYHTKDYNPLLPSKLDDKGNIVPNSK
jgi:hypothetical protein|tara:strand:+ start:574 stop:1269 length:696 start_codon:yes stop_codon:yes gene_type:complete